MEVKFYYTYTISVHKKNCKLIHIINGLNENLKIVRNVKKEIKINLKHYTWSISIPSIMKFKRGKKKKIQDVYEFFFIE